MELRGKNKIQQRTFNEINGVFSPMAVCANLRIANDNFVPFLRNVEIKKSLYILTFFFRIFLLKFVFFNYFFIKPRIL